MHTVGLQIALLVFAGIASQWLAWRFRVPAIALLLIAGLVAGPLTGLHVPEEVYGDLYHPVVGLAVAIILFEGGLTLNFAEIRETAKAVRRIVLIGAPLIWLFGTLAGYYLGGLSFEAAIILGAILIVTGPTVIMPLLRQAKLQKRSASLLRWEAIINDPLGALAAVLAFEIFLVFNNVHDADGLFISFLLMLIVAIPGAWLLAKAIVYAFVKGHVPEFLKLPLVLSLVVLAYALTNAILEEAGLLTVTVMGIVLANSRLASLQEMKRFKETVTIILVSAVFIVLASSLKYEAILSLGLPALLFVASILFVVRPVAIWIATINTGLSWQERVLTAWIAPRGIVAVAIAGVFGAALANQGFEDGDKIIAYAFAVVAATIFLHGFSLPILARVLGLRSTAKPGILFVGSSAFSRAFAEKLREQDIPVLIADTNHGRLRPARSRDIPVYYGDILSEHAHHHVNLADWESAVATTDNDAYNALVCSELGPEIGRGNVFQIAGEAPGKHRDEMKFTIGGRRLAGSEFGYSDYEQRIVEGWKFSAVRTTDQYRFEDVVEAKGEGSLPILWIEDDGQFVFFKRDSQPPENVKILMFSPSD